MTTAEQFDAMGTLELLKQLVTHAEQMGLVQQLEQLKELQKAAQEHLEALEH